MTDISGNQPVSTDILRLTFDQNFDFSLYIHKIILIALVCIVAFIILRLKTIGFFRFWHQFELNEAEFGIGQGKVRLSPNLTDKQIAYKIWVELSTRKIGLPINLNDDVITEIYDSWYNFFSVTRELIKDVPVTKFNRKDTELIIKLSIEVLNKGIRPHLTKWQARFRRWYDRQLLIEANVDLHPQEIQRRFPEFSELERDLTLVNTRLMNYRDKMYEVVTGVYKNPSTTVD